MTDPAAGRPIAGRPLCFVLMPFGEKKDASGRSIQFDRVYRELIRPAIEKAGMEAIRADEEQAGGIIHRQMFERLVLCDFAVADLTISNANVYYELGIRHAVRPWSTISIFSHGSRLPFDVFLNRSMPYHPDLSNDSTRDADIESLTELLVAAKQGARDSPFFELLSDLDPPDLDRLDAESFRDREQIVKGVRERLAQARGFDGKKNSAILADLNDLRGSLGPVDALEIGVVLDLMLSYRAASAWQEMVDLVGEMAEVHRRLPVVREQQALALNRMGQGDSAERLLISLLEEQGASSETYGILGRIYKDRWKVAQGAKKKGLLKKAIDAYRKGFEADWRDAYPGINLVTLMEVSHPPVAEREQLLPVVLYSCRRRIESRHADYWDHATLLEVAVLSRDQEQAQSALEEALAYEPEGWQRQTTADNLALIREARQVRAEPLDWALAIESELRLAPGEAD